RTVKKYFEEYNNTTLSLQFECKVSAGSAPGSNTIDFGNGKVFTMTITSDGELKVEKTSGDYNGTTGIIEYSVKVMAVNGTITDIDLNDVITTGNAKVSGSSKYFTLDGKELGSRPTKLAADDGFIWKYYVKVDDDVIDTTKTADRATIENTVTVNGKTNGNPISKTAKDTKNINYTNLKKTAVSIDNDKKTITWQIQLGDGLRPLSSIFGNKAAITETLSDAGLYTQKFSSQSVEVTYADDLGNKTSETISWNGKDTLNVPTGSAYLATFQLTSSYSAKDKDKVGMATFTNNVTVKTVGGSVSDKTSVTKGVEGVGNPKVNKTITRNDDDNVLHYTITANIPGGYANVPGFYLQDAISAIGPVTFSNDPVNLTITAYKDSDAKNPVVYTDDRTNAEDHTYFTVSSGGKNEVLTIYFNTPDSDKEDSKWIFTEDSTLVVEYDLPLDKKSGSTTVQKALDDGGTLTNTATLYYNNGQKLSDDDTYGEKSEYVKKGKYNANTDIIDYTYTFYNYYNEVRAVTTLTSDEFIFTDKLGEGLTFVEDSLTLEFHDGGGLQAAYKYTKKIGGLDELSVSTDDFIMIGDDSKTPVDFLTDKWTIRYTEKIVYRYQAKVDRESKVFTGSDAGNTVDLTNTAGLSILKEGKEVKGLPDTTATVKVPNRKVVKLLSDLHDTNRVPFEIDLNYGSEDLVKNEDTYTVVDRLSENLSPVLNTIEVWEKENGKWTIFECNYRYDSENGVMEFPVPDSAAVKILYDVKINETGSGIPVSNSAAIKGMADFTDQASAVFDVQKADADASASITSFNLFKCDEESKEGLKDAVFAMYGPQHSTRQGDADEDSATYGAVIPKTVETDGGVTLYYYQCYTTNEYGVAQISSINMSIGGMYSFKEIIAPEGYVKDDDALWTIYAFEYPATGADKSVEVMVEDDNLVIENEAEEVPEGPDHEIVIRKTDMAGKELNGAILEVTGTADNSGKIEPISWETDTQKEPDGHTIDLKAGAYTLTETYAPEGYVKAESIDFTVDDDGKVYIDGSKKAEKTAKVTMVDDYETFEVVIHKTDEDGEELSNAKLKVSGTSNLGGKITPFVWTTSTKKESDGHTIELTAGTYTLSETKAPDGYAKADPITFEVDENGKITVDGEEVTELTMVDERLKLAAPETADSSTIWPYMSLLMLSEFLLIVSMAYGAVLRKRTAGR
ncbi:MAG: hypothetical protein HUJ58_08940, partial [Erysipelotrichaceae bacterium]|nr:hypothetical protein [Erysipelotrichaceae bacterium]